VERESVQQQIEKEEQKFVQAAQKFLHDAMVNIETGASEQEESKYQD